MPAVRKQRLHAKHNPTPSKDTYHGCLRTVLSAARAQGKTKISIGDLRKAVYDDRSNEKQSRRSRVYFDAAVMQECISGNLSITTGQAGTVCVDLVPQDPPVANEARAVLPSDNTRHHAPLKEETEEGEQGGKPRLQDSSVVQLSEENERMLDAVKAIDACMREIDFTYLYDNVAQEGFRDPDVHTIGLRLAIQRGGQILPSGTSPNRLEGEHGRVNILRLAEIPKEVAFLVDIMSNYQEDYYELSDLYQEKCNEITDSKYVTIRTRDEMDAEGSSASALGNELS